MFEKTTNLIYFMSKSSYHRAFKVIFVTSAFCLVSIVALIGLSTLASKYAKSYKGKEKPYTDSNLENKTPTSPVQNSNPNLTPLQSLDNSKSNH